MKIEVDRSRWDGLGICEGLAPGVFEVDENGELILLTERIDSRALVDVEGAAAGCPMEALRLTES